MPKTQALRDLIEEHGGLVTAYEMRENWGLSKTRLHGIMSMPGFPAPIAEIGAAGQKVYLAAEVDDFRAMQKDRKRSTSAT